MTRRRFGLLVLLVGGPVIALIWIGIAAFLAQNEHAALRGTERDTLNLARAFEENITRTVESIDTTMRAIRAARARDPNHFDLAGWVRIPD